MKAPKSFADSFFFSFRKTARVPAGARIFGKMWLIAITLFAWLLVFGMPFRSPDAFSSQKFFASLLFAH